jgi:hypothetical protein
VNVNKIKDDIHREFYTISGTLTSHYGSKINVNYTGNLYYQKNIMILKMIIQLLTRQNKIKLQKQKNK